MLKAKERANIATVALVFDLVSDPMKHAQDKDGRSLTAQAAIAISGMSIADRTAFFEKWLDRLTLAEREEFRHFVGYGYFKEDRA